MKHPVLSVTHRSAVNRRSAGQRGPGYSAVSTRGKSEAPFVVRVPGTMRPHVAVLALLIAHQRNHEILHSLLSPIHSAIVWLLLV